MYHQFVLKNTIKYKSIINRLHYKVNSQKGEKMEEIKLITSNDLQEMGFSRTKAFEILSDPSLPVVRIGRRKYVCVDDFKKWMKEKTINADRNRR